jgi:thiol:disulfide interchange protein DsbA
MSIKGLKLSVCLGLSVLLSSLLASAQTVPAQPQPYRLVDIGPGYRTTVVEAMEFGCPYCRALNDGLMSWSATLPAGWHFIQMPTVTDVSYVPMAQSYFSAVLVSPSNTLNFEDAAFALIQDDHQPLNSLITYAHAASSAGIQAEAYVHALTSAPVKKEVFEDVRVMQRAGIQATPTLILCGKYAITPSDTNGNYSMFIQLANGLISQCIRDKGGDK